jgi:fructose-1,6-bisphosphatase/inositol monophosphatase family enzyme
MVLTGGVDAMVDCDLNPWDAAATQVLVPEAGGVCHSTRQPNGKTRLVLGSAPLCDQLLALIDEA